MASTQEPLAQVSATSSTEPAAAMSTLEGSPLPSGEPDTATATGTIAGSIVEDADSCGLPAEGEVSAVGNERAVVSAEAVSEASSTGNRVT